ESTIAGLLRLRGAIAVHRFRSLGASVAQLDRASDYGSEGSRFNSWRMRQQNKGLPSALEMTICRIASPPSGLPAVAARVKQGPSMPAWFARAPALLALVECFPRIGLPPTTPPD